MAKNKSKKQSKEKISIAEENLKNGIYSYNTHHFLHAMGIAEDNLVIADKTVMPKCAAYVDCRYNKRYWREKPMVIVNKDFLLSPSEWTYTIAHCAMHLAFGHFDAEKMPGYEVTDSDGNKQWKVSCDNRLWNMACDIFVAKFLVDAGIGTPTGDSLTLYNGPLKDEISIYNYLCENPKLVNELYFGTALRYQMDMKNLDKPIRYDKNNPYPYQKNYFSERFARGLAENVSEVVEQAGGHEKAAEKNTASAKAANWFINRYPLLGALASGFKIIEDSAYCRQNEIQVAAVDVSKAEIYVNPVAGLNDAELKFVLAHEFLHAGLQHYERCQGRDPYLWNVACDFVINGWLYEMNVGEMPAGILYDETLKNKSAEEIYDELVRELRKNSKLSTLRGYGKGDIIGGSKNFKDQVSLDEFYKSTLQNGLEYHRQNLRGYIPAGLIEEIRTLAMPPIAWDVELGNWFDIHFTPLEKKRTYARPSRRQGSTPDIPRPSYVADVPEYSRTFGVVIDTSGSMSAKLIGYALGAVASYSAAKEVPFARVIFCDAAAYDAGYLSPEDIAGRVEVKGRGGTILQPGVDKLIDAKDFPKDAPILIITDGEIEDNLKVKREHTFLIPRGKRLPFKARGKIFYFTEN